MLLVALMSVTIFSAEAQNSIPYQIVSATEGFGAGTDCWFFTGKTGHVIVETAKKYKITSCYFPKAHGQMGDASKAILYGSNDNATWKQLATFNYTDANSRNVSVMSSVAYKYYRVDYSEPDDYRYPLSAGILDLRTDEPVIKGFGTEENPYIIESAIDFHMLKECQIERGSFYARVNNDIDFSDVQSWQSVDLSATPFVLDGNCMELKNLKGTNGLFSSINGATIKNLGIANAIINTDAECCGFLSNTATNSTFTNCYVIGDFTNTNASAINGAFVGKAQGATKFSKCYAVTNLDDDDAVHLALCGADNVETSMNDCMYYGDGMDKSYVSSGFIAYHINRSDLPTGPYYQKIGSDLYPHLNCTGDNYVYAIDSYTFTNSCTHQLKNHSFLKAPSCDDNSGHVEYYQCQNELCKALIGVDGRIFEDEKEMVLSMTPIVIKEFEKWGNGRWSIKDKITKDGKEYYDVAEVTVEEHIYFNGDRSVQYTFLDSETDSLNVHAFFSGTIDCKTQGLRFFVNGVERKDLAYEMNEGGDKHCVTVIKSLNKYDIIMIVYNNNIQRNSSLDVTTLSIALEHSHKPGDAHDIKRIPTVYDCMTGGYLEHNACVKCGLEFFDKEDEEKEWESMNHEFFLQEYFLQPTGQHDFVLSHQTTELGLLKYVCQRYTCKATDPNHFCIENCIDNENISVTKSGETYTANAESITLPDAVAYNSPVSFEVGNLTYTRDFYPNVWNSWFVPFATTCDELAYNGVTDVAIIESIHNYDTDHDGMIDKTVLEVIKKKNGTLKGGTPYLVKTSMLQSSPMVFSESKTLKASTYIVPVHTETASASYDFMGTYSGLTSEDLSDANYYCLDAVGDMIHHTQDILPQRWYAKETAKENPYDELPPAPLYKISISVIGEEDEPTGIRTLYATDEQTEEPFCEGIYDLNGRRLSVPQPGMINIINGKKQLVR